MDSVTFGFAQHFKIKYEISIPLFLLPQSLKMLSV